MNCFLRISFFVAALLLVACAQPVLVVGQTRTAIEPDDVVVYFIERPQCNFETVAHIKAAGGYYSLQGMLVSMREQAAEIGASGLFVTHTQQLDIKEYLGVARAIRCLST